MKAILTKVLPATNTKPTRIEAYAEGGKRVIVSASYCEREEDGYRQDMAHLRAAQALCEKMGWSGDLLGGGTPDGYAFVFADTSIRTKTR